MITLKFGGTSMESARRILSSADIIIFRAEAGRVSVVVSAVAGVSNKLQESIDACVKGMHAENFVHELRKIHSDICEELQSKLPSLSAASVLKELMPIFEEYEKLLTGCVSFGECPGTIHCRIMGDRDRKSVV